MTIGILDPLYDAVAWLVMRIHDILAVWLGPSSGATWALSIVVLVVFMRLLLLPLFVKQMHSQRKMLALAPEIQKLRKQYKNDKQKLNEETMKLYRENGANPLSGCLPLVAQLPVWFALLAVLRALSEKEAKFGMTTKVVAEANRAHILGVTIGSKFLFQHPGSSGTDKLVIGCTVIISAVTTFLTVRQSTKRGLTQTGPPDPDNPMAGAQKYMMYIAPVFALSGLYWQYGLVVYWLTSNVWTLGQQYFLFKKIPPLNAQGITSTTEPSTAPRVSTTTLPSTKSRPTSGQSAARTTAARQAGAKSAAARPAGAKSAAGTAAKSSAGKPGAAKPAGAKQTAAKPAGATSGAGKQAAGTKPASNGTAAANGTAKKPASASTPSAKTSPPKKPADAKREAASLGIPPPTAESSGGGGLLRKLGRKSAEPEPEPEQPEVTLVRQQRVKQSRSKRSGKR